MQPLMNRAAVHHAITQADADVRRKTLPKVAAAPTVGHLLNELFEAMCEG